METSVKDLIGRAAYREQNTHVFPSASSLDWFIRQHRTELIQSGAIVKIAKRWLVAPTVFDTTAIQIGKRLAQGGL